MRTPEVQEQFLNQGRFQLDSDKQTSLPNWPESLLEFVFALVCS